MTIRKTLPLGIGVASLLMAGSAYAQSPFTIRKPLDSATVREKVRVEIPRASVSKPGSFVAFFIDDKFVVAQAPEGDAKSKEPFIYVWDTKSTDASDGEHTIKAVLFEAAAGGNGSVTEAGSTSVKVTIANKITDGPNSLRLRYRYREGESLEYARSGSTKLKGGEQQGAAGTGDTELGSVRSRLLIGIEDTRGGEDVSLVRNKLTSLSLLTNGQEITASPDQLSESMYQELDTRGKVLYETGNLAGLAEFSQDGVPVGNTLELPLLPESPVSVGSTWRQPLQRIDIPGVPAALQPKVLLESKLEGLEWENNRPAAKIVETYTGELKTPIRVSGMLITTPSVTYKRTIYFAYKSGVLLRIARDLTIKGRTMDGPSASPAMAGGMGMGAMMAGMAGMGRPGGAMGAASGPPPGMGAMMAGMAGMGRGQGATSGPPPGMGAMMAGMGRPGGQSGRTQRGNRGRGSFPGGSGGMMGMGSMGAMMGAGEKGGMRSGGNRNSGAGNPMSGGNRFAGAAAQGERDRGVTIESTQNTELQKVSGS